MTVIAYKNNTMVADSRTVYHGFLMTKDSDKIHQTDFLVYGVAGDADDRALQELLKQVKIPSDLPTVKDLLELGQDFTALIKFRAKKHVYILSTDKDYAFIHSPQTLFWAIGSGGPFAMGAMQFGASAEEAVRTAIALDPGCGTPLQTVPC